MPETRETACCDIHSPVVCEPDTVVTVPCCPNCPSWPTPETAKVPDEIRAAALEAVNAAQWEDGHRYGEHGQHAFNAACAVCQGDMERVLPVALAAVLPAHEATVVPPGHVVVARADLEAYLNRGKDLPAETAALERLRAALGEQP